MEDLGELTMPHNIKEIPLVVAWLKTTTGELRVLANVTHSVPHVQHPVELRCT